MKHLIKMAAATALLAATQANATVIDFGSAAWTPAANNHASYTVNNVTAAAGPTGAVLFANDPNDGLGVKCSANVCAGPDELDEINAGEYLTVSFASAAKLYNVKLTDFFPKSHHNEPSDGSVASGEKGWISLWLGNVNVGTFDIYGANSTVYMSSAWTDEGDQTFNFAGQAVTSIKFWAAGKGDEFSVKSISAEVPEPGLLGLLGLGMLCLGLSRRQAKSA